MVPRAQIGEALERTGFGTLVTLGLSNRQQDAAALAQRAGFADEPEPSRRERAADGYRIGLARAVRRAPPGLRVDRTA